MKIRKQNGPPEDLIYFDEDLNLTQNNVEDVVEIFKTPLTGSYNWDYTVADNRIKKLYELGKELNWNGSIDLNWDYTHPSDERLIEPDEELPHETLEAYQKLSEEEKILFDRHSTAELMSQFLHGEQGALLVASQLASCAQPITLNCMQHHKHLTKLGMLRFLINIYRTKLVYITPLIHH